MRGIIKRAMARQAGRRHHPVHPFFTKLRQRRERFTPMAAWNGLPCKATCGTVKVGVSPAPAAWSRDIEGQHRKCVRVVQDGQTFYLDDLDHSGSRKVWLGKGMPSWPHNSITVDDHDSFKPFSDL